MRMWSWLGTAFVVVLLQTTSIGFFRGSLYFDLPLIFIYALALFYGPRVGLMAGVAFGLLQDLSSPSVFGFCILTRGAAGYLVGRVKEMIFKNNGAYHVLLIGSLSLGLRLLYAVPVLALSPYGRAVPDGNPLVLPGKYGIDRSCGTPALQAVPVGTGRRFGLWTIKYLRTGSSSCSWCAWRPLRS